MSPADGPTSQARGLRRRYREGQEDQLGALGLVVNIVVLWNTRYLGVALDRLRAAGGAVDAEEVARLEPGGFGQINLQGRYTFVLAEPLARGALRPLRNPAAEDLPQREFAQCRRPEWATCVAEDGVPLLLDTLPQRSPTGRPRRGSEARADDVAGTPGWCYRGPAQS